MKKLIDTLAHPTVSGTWLDKKDYNASIEKLVNELKKSPFTHAFAVGLPNMDGYSNRMFFNMCDEYDELIPIAGLDVNQDLDLVMRDLEEIVDEGFNGIKIHPRFSYMNYEKNYLDIIFKYAAENELVVFYCTYPHCSAPNYPEVDPFYSLVKVINQNPHTKLILVHGGVTDILKYAELARFNDNILLDLSLTIMNYPDSSIDSDLKFLFNNFDRKITIGTDWPEYKHKDVYERVLHFSKGVSQDKLDNIFYKNINNFHNFIIE